MPENPSQMARMLSMLQMVANKSNPLSNKINPGNAPTEGAGAMGTGGGSRVGSRGVNPDGSVNPAGKGAIDRENGKTLSDNPYFPGTKTHAAWERGFKGE
jgi:hypothetical protein